MRRTSSPLANPLDEIGQLLLPTGGWSLVNLLDGIDQAQWVVG
jgi:hypothetical protein